MRSNWRTQLGQPSNLRWVVVASLLACVSCGPTTSEDAFPRKPIKIIVYTGPGGPIDITARKFVEIARQHTPATFVVENKPGAGGLTAMKKVLQSPADGYTLCACTKSNIAKVVAEGREGYLDAFDWVAMMMRDPECVITLNDSPVADWGTFIARLNDESPEQVWLGPAVGGLDHLTAMQIWERFGIRARWLPHKSGGDALSALLGRQGVAYVGNPSEAAGNPDLTVAVVSSGERLPQIPDTPTFSEFDASELDTQYMWRGFALKKGCPPLVRQWYDRLFAAVSSDPRWRAMWEKDGIDVTYLPSQEFTQVVQRDRDEAFRYLSQLDMLNNDQGARPTWLVWAEQRGLLLVLSLQFVAAIWISRVGDWNRDGPLFVTGAILSFCLLFFLQTLAFRSTQGVGAATVPRLWMGAIVFLSIPLIVTHFHGRRVDTGPVDSPAQTQPWRRVLMLGLLLVGYLLTIVVLGYLLGSFLFLIAAAYLLGERRPHAMLLLSSAWVAFAYVTFVRLLSVPLPKGLLFE